jgi:hypothetical protein
MARGHGRILTLIWEDADFLALTQEQQRLYLFLISQPNLNHAGLLPLTLRRWARKAAGLTPAELDAHLAALAAARFIVLDEDTEELLIRSFVRNDGVWKQPKVMGAMVSGAMEISSRLLRAALLAEMDRIPLDELSDEPTKVRNVAGPSIREQVSTHIETLRKAFGGSTPPPGEGRSATPSGLPSGTPSASPSEPPAEAPAEGGPEASTRVGACARDARVPLPLPLSPAPSPVPDPPVRRGEGSERATGSSAREPQTALSLIPPDWQPTNADRHAAAADIKRLGPAATDRATAKFIRHQQSRGTRAANFGPAWVTWLTRERPDTPQQGAFLVGLPGGGNQPTPTPSAFAQRMAELDAAAARDDRPASYGERLADRNHDTA